MKQRLKTIKGKRVVLTNDPNLVGRNELGIISKGNTVDIVKQGGESVSGNSSSNNGNLEYLYIKLNSLGTNMANNTLPTGYKIVQVIASYSMFSPVAGGNVTYTYKYNLLEISNIVKVYSLTYLGIKLLKINEDGCDATSLAAIVEKYPNWSVCEEISKEEYESLK